MSSTAFLLVFAPMRIALVAPFGLRAKGSTRGRALPLARALARRGHEVTLFIPPYDSAQDSGRCWNEQGVVVRNMRWLATGARSRGDLGLREAWSHLALAMELWHAVRTWQPQLIHVFKPKGPSGLAAAIFWATRFLSGKGGGIDVPALVVDVDDWEGPGGWNDDPRLGYTLVQRWFFAWQERFGFSHADAWTVASACLRERAVRYGAGVERVFVLPNGVESKVAMSFSAGLQRCPHSILLYTRFAGVCLADVIAVWSRVRQELPDARLIVVGRGLAGEEEALRGLPGVELKGWVLADELGNILQYCSVALVLWANTPANRARSSVKVRELMAASLAIVGYDIGELPITLADSGVLVPAGDVDACAQAVIELLRYPLRAQDIGARARERVLTHFNWDQLVDIALAAYAAAGLSEGV